MLDDHRLFFRQFRQNFHSTGAVSPSSRWLGQALAHYVPGSGAPRRILEVGPGTGAVTRWILPRLGAADTLDLVEMNGDFVARLQDRFEREPDFRAVSGRVRILHQPVEQLPAAERYDAVVSGLPLNNFSGEIVEHLLKTLVNLLAPAGTLSFFEYVGVRSAKLVVARGSERERLGLVDRHLRKLLDHHEFHRVCVMRNLPPAWVHHVRVATP